MNNEFTQYIVNTNHAGTRLDAYLTDITQLSRSHVQSLIKDGAVIYNGKTPKPSLKIEEGHTVTITMPEISELDITPEDIPLDIIFEDEHILVINKAKGMVVHPAPGHYTGTLVNAIMHHCKGSLSSINGIARPGIVHRIDKDTSGILVIAKNNQAHNGLASQFAEHTIQRAYRSIVFGNVKEDKRTINAPIGRSQKDRKKMTVTQTNSKHAITHIQVLERFFYKGASYTYIEARLETGRTHQIRVHMAHIGHPVIGDEIYGYKKQPFKTSGQVLHAIELGFKHPCISSCETKKNDDKNVLFSTSLPPYFLKILDSMKA